MRTILAGFDGSPSAVSALAWATAEARRHGARLTVLTATGSLPGPLAHRATKITGEAVAAPLRRLARDVAGETVAEHLVDPAPPAAALVAAAGSFDLLVVGSRGRSQAREVLLGSVSRACVHHAASSVAVVRSDYDGTEPHHRVVVGVDSSPSARQALVTAGRCAELRGVALQVVNAVHWDHLGAEFLAPTAEQLVEWGRELVEAELAATGVSGRPEVVAGVPSRVLSRLSAHADLLVVGSRGLNPLASLLVGSTSDYCVQHARCPVLVVRQG